MCGGGGVGVCVEVEGGLIGKMEQYQIGWRDIYRIKKSQNDLFTLNITINS